jgi:tetratricopeptide (TPR) repeat protein
VLSPDVADRCCADGESRVLSLNNRAAEATAKKDYAKALALLDEAIRSDPSLFVTYYNRAAVTYSYKGDLERTVSDCTKALELAGRPFPAALRLRARAYRGKGEFKKAEADLRAAIETEPTNHDLRVDLGQVFCYAENWGKALAEFDGVCKADPRHYAALAWRGHAYCAQGEFKKALKDLDDAIGLKPGEKLAFFFRANAYFQTKDAGRALADCERVLSVEPDQDGFEIDWYARLHLTRGVIRAVRGDLRSAKADFNEAIRLAPDLPEHYLVRGKLLSKERNYENAVADFSECIRLASKMPEAYEMRAAAHEMRSAAYLALGDREKSAADEKTAKDLRKKVKEKKADGK